MAYTANKMRCRAKRFMIHDDPADATVARYISPSGAGTFYDMRDYGSFLAMAMIGTLAGGVLTYKIFGAKSAAGDTPLEIVAHAAPTDCDAAGDFLVLECTAEQLHALGAGYRYIGVEIDNDAAGDVMEHYFELGEPRFPQDDLTDDYIS